MVITTNIHISETFINEVLFEKDRSNYRGMRTLEYNENKIGYHYGSVEKNNLMSGTQRHRYEI